MKHPRSINDHSMALAKVLLDMVAPNYREEEHRDIFDAFFTACKAGFTHFETDIARIEKHTMPRWWNQERR